MAANQNSVVCKKAPREESSEELTDHRGRRAPMPGSKRLRSGPFFTVIALLCVAACGGTNGQSTQTAPADGGTVEVVNAKLADTELEPWAVDADGVAPGDVEVAFQQQDDQDSDEPQPKMDTELGAETTATDDADSLLGDADPLSGDAAIAADGDGLADAGVDAVATDAAADCVLAPIDASQTAPAQYGEWAIPDNCTIAADCTPVDGSEVTCLFGQCYYAAMWCDYGGDEGQCADPFGITWDICQPDKSGKSPLGGVCVHACSSAGDCSSESPPCHVSFCWQSYECDILIYKEVANCCVSNWDCDDADPCTKDSCDTKNPTWGGGKCKHEPVCCSP